MAVLINGRYAFKAYDNGSGGLGCILLPTPRAIGIVPGPEQINQFAGNAMLPAQRVNKGGEAIRETRLAPIAEDGAEQDDGAFSQDSGNKKFGETVIFTPTLE